MLHGLRSGDTRWAALALLCVGMLMIVLDGTVVNVALPSIQTDLAFTPSNLAWVVNAYMIAFGGLLLLAGRLGDLLGAKRIFIAGLALFTLASLLCGVATSRELLIGARFLQGVGGAFASSVILSMIVTMFEEPAERAQALSAFSFTAAAGGSVGLLVGGALTQIASWHAVFLINVPIGIAAILLARRYLLAGKPLGLREGADAFGAASITAGLMLAVYAVVELPSPGAAHRTLLAAVLATLAFVAFIVRQATARTPLLPLGLFRSRNLSGSNVLQVLLVAGMFGFFFLDSLYLRRVLGYTAVATGLAFLPITLAIGWLSISWSARLALRFGPRLVIIVGVAVAALGLAIAAMTFGGSYLALFPSMLLLGIGMGVAFPSLMMFAMQSATSRDSGLISGLINTTAQVGGALGLALLATLATVTSYQTAFAAAAGCLAGASLIAVVVLRSPDPATAERREAA